MKTKSNKTINTAAQNEVKLSLTPLATKQEQLNSALSRQYVRVAAATPSIVLADVKTNVTNILTQIERAAQAAVHLLVFSDLALTGASCGQLFKQKFFAQQALAGINEIARKTRHLSMLILLSLPLALDDKIIKCTAMLFQGEIVGLTPARQLSSEEKDYFSAPPCSFDSKRNDLPIPVLTAPLEEIIAYNEISMSANREDLFDHSAPSKFLCEITLDEIEAESLLCYAYDYVNLCTVAPCITVHPASLTFTAQTQNSDKDSLRPEKGGVPLLAVSDSRAEFPGDYAVIRSKLLERSENEQGLVVYTASGEGESTSNYVRAGHRLIVCDGEVLEKSNTPTS